MLHHIIRTYFLFNLSLLSLFIGVSSASSYYSPTFSNDRVFHRVKEGLLKEQGIGLGIRFDRSWLFESDLRVASSDRIPTHLPLPSFVRVYNLNEEADESLENLASAARDIINQDLSQHGAVLLRNLHYQIKSPADFAYFWQNICDTDNNDWETTRYMPLGKGRETMDGLDLANNLPPQYPLRCHNEMAYNPNPPSRIAFYCLQDAKEGGETILCRNADLTDSMRDDIIQHVKEHGILYERRYPTLEKKKKERSAKVVGEAGLPTLSWQEKCQTNNKKDAIEFFIAAGFSETDIWFDKDETLVVSNKHSGFWSETKSSDEGNHDDLWFNVLPFATFAKRASDGTDFSSKMGAQIRLDGWKSVHAFKLRPGDWLILNNRTVQHGRLPFQENPTGTVPRTLLTVYTK